MSSPAPCLKKFLADATLRWPNRSRASDGIMPSAAHTKANPTSDHERGNAADVTNDRKNGADCALIATALVASHDPRIKYLIWNREIWYLTEGVRARGWSRYRGKNPHTTHLHVSIKPESRDDLSPWPWSPVEPVKPKYGDAQEFVMAFQRAHGLTVDGIPGRLTFGALEK